MKTSRAFAIAKKNLWNGTDGTYKTMEREKFCCVALAEYVDDCKVVRRCQGILENLLGAHGTLESWLAERGHLPVNYFYSTQKKTYREKIQTTRKAWLKHLIKHYKAIGD
jgi:hypothetical protein